MKESQRKYEKKLRDLGIVRRKCFQIKCHVDHDKDIIDFIETLPNKSGFVKALIRDYMNKQKEYEKA